MENLGYNNLKIIYADTKIVFRNEVIMKQTNVAGWIKGITIAIGIMGIVFFAGVMPYAAKIFFSENTQIAFLYLPTMIFGGITAIFCYAVLFQFWKVCLQIEKDRSFSKENVKSFSVMSKLLLVLAALWITYLLVHLVFGWATFEMIWRMILFSFLWSVIACLCAALSVLIEKAMKIQEENDLTI